MERPQATEYLVLRQTIAQRGALRPVLVLGGMTIWAALLIAVLALVPYPVAAAIPLLILVVTFEVIRPLHFGAERIGRYLQVFHEEGGEPDRSYNDTPAWERVAMRFSSVPGVGGHPLFIPLFFFASTVNAFLYATLLRPRVGIEDAVIAGLHGIFVAWMFITDRAMRKQRDADLARLRELRDQSRGTP
jgi:hypothetical protein